MYTFQTLRAFHPAKKPVSVSFNTEILPRFCTGHPSCRCYSKKSSSHSVLTLLDNSPGDHARELYLQEVLPWNVCGNTVQGSLTAFQVVSSVSSPMPAPSIAYRYIYILCYQREVCLPLKNTYTEYDFFVRFQWDFYTYILLWLFFG